MLTIDLIDECSFLGVLGIQEKYIESQLTTHMQLNVILKIESITCERNPNRFFDKWQ